MSTLRPVDNTEREDGETARAFRDAMVDKLRDWGCASTPSVEAAMRVVPRHVFVPEASLEQAYANDSVVTHRDQNGRAISSASAPGVVASMLEQLDVQPGHRILEIGAGTGYNAALVAELAGAQGQVTTVDIGADLVAGARRHLAAAGYDRVQVVHGDGAAGHPDNAPYDRIIVTAGAWDVPPAWRQQLAPGGRLVVPLRIRGVTRSVALTLDDDVWRSVSINECGFMPMRGPSAVGETTLELGEGSGVWLRVDDGQPIDADTFATTLVDAPALAWSGVVVPWTDTAVTHLDFWLTGTEPICRVLVSDQAREAGLVEPIYPWGSMGCYIDDGTFAYLIRRPAVGDTSQETVELGVCAYGPGSKRLADEVADRVRAWDAARARGDLAKLRIEVHPKDSADAPTAMITATKTNSTVIVITS